MTEPVYRDPRALRQAVTDRLRRLANERSASELSDLQRQFAYDRLLSRVFQADRDGWVLKGATAMLARLEGQARHTVRRRSTPPRSRSRSNPSASPPPRTP